MGVVWFWARGGAEVWTIGRAAQRPRTADGSAGGGWVQELVAPSREGGSGGNTPEKKFEILRYRR